MPHYHLRGWILIGLVVRRQHRIVGNVDVHHISYFQLIRRQLVHLQGRKPEQNILEPLILIGINGTFKALTT